MAIFMCFSNRNDLPNLFLIKRDKVLHDLSLSHIKQIDSMLLCVCSVIDHIRHQNVVRIYRDTLGYCFVCLFFVLTTFCCHL